MALGTNHNTNTTGAVYVPELWENEIIATYKENLVLANLICKINHKGKRGDSIHIPKFTRNSANVKVAEQQVTLNANTEGEIVIPINKHYEYSTIIEDLFEIQGLPTMRQAYTEDMGHALAKQSDTDLHGLGALLQGGASYSAAVAGDDGSTAWDGSVNTNTGNGVALADVGLREMIQALDDVDTPMAQRFLVVPPVERKNLMGINRFTEDAFVGNGDVITGGKFGSLYGVPLFISTNCATVTAADTTTNYRVGLIGHKDAFVLAEQQGVRTQTQYKQEYLGNLMTADCVYGVKVKRDDAAVAFITPA